MPMSQGLPTAADPPLPLRLLVAVGVTLLALGLSLALRELVAGNPFILFFAATAVAAWYGGLAGGLVSTALGVVLSNYFLIPPYGTIAVRSLDLIRLGIFALVAMLISSLSAARRAAEARAWAEADRFRVTLASIGDAVISTDAAGRVTFMNAVAEELTGWPRAEALGQLCAAIFDIVNETSGAPVESPVERVLREGVVIGLANHTLLRARDGSLRPIDDSGAPIRGPDGRVSGAVLVFRDQTNRREAEREREALLAASQSARLAAEEAVKLRDVFFSVAAHELRTPLTALLGRAQLIQRRAARERHLDERDTRALGVITAQAQRLNQLIGAMLDVARIEQGRLSIAAAPLDLGELVARVVEELRPMLERHSLRLHACAEPLPIQGDALRLEQLLQNLLDNAVKYSPEGGEVTVRVERAGGQARLTVSDQGIGIPAAALPSLFERFFRADGSDRPQVSGLGVGLYVVREVVSLHGGVVSVESEEGRGSSFIITLPLAEGGH